MAHVQSLQQANGLSSLQVLRASWICKDTLAPVAPFPNNLARGLTALGLPPAGGFPVRPKFLLPKVVHAVLLQAAQPNLTDTTRLDFIPQFGPLGVESRFPSFGGTQTTS